MYYELMGRKRSDQLEFGGPWTHIKLAALESYLPAYTRILTTNPRAKHFSTIYLDAFAGSGKMQYLPTSQAKLFDSSKETDLKGSASRALEVTPEFNRYIFIETSKAAAKSYCNSSSNSQGKKSTSMSTMEMPMNI
jgi:three-Cys-motif partner protein